MNSTLVAPTRRDFEEVPNELKALKRWVTWRYERRGDKPTKRPTQSIAEPQAWLTFDDAVASYLFREVDGIGFVLGDGFVGIDLDGAIGPGGKLHQVAVDALAIGSYTERSPSRKGLHALIAGTIKRSQNIRPIDGIPGREIYDGGRFFTITGDRISAAKDVARGSAAQTALNAFMEKWFPERPVPAPTVEAERPHSIADERIVQLLFAAKNGAKTRRLYNGDSAGYPSASEADYAFVRCIRFYSQDAGQIERIFRASGRVRDKIAVHPSYLRDTIAKALRAGGKVYRPETEAARVARLLDRQLKARANIPLWMVSYLSKVGAIPILVLLVISAYADDGGNGSPSIATIAGHLSIDESLVCRGIKVLEESKVLSHDRQFNAENKYLIQRKRTDAQVTPFAPKRAAALTSEQGKAPDLNEAKGLTSHECLTTLINTEEEVYIV